MTPSYQEQLEAKGEEARQLQDALLVAEGHLKQLTLQSAKAISLREEVLALRAERDKLRDQWSDLLIEQARLMALRDEAVQQRDAAIAERDALRKDAAELRLLVAHDAFAYTFQTMGQYRTALLKVLDAALAVQPTTALEPDAWDSDSAIRRRGRQ